MRSIAELVEPDRVHRTVYTDQEIFDREIEQIFEKIWVYCGHESQVKAPGDYYTVQIGRQPMIMVRDRAGAINVLHNRCPHRGVELCGALSGNTGSSFVCSYHAWSFHLDGSIRGIPLPQGYEGTRMNSANPDCSMKRAARVGIYRGFVFASLAGDGPTLEEFLGDARIAFDDMCDRSPEGEVEIVPVCHRVIQHSNWKFFMENQLDALHPSVTHQSTGASASKIERRLQGEGRRGAALLSLSVDLRLLVRSMGLGADREFPARTRHLEGLHGSAAQRPRHPGIYRGHVPGLRRRARGRISRAQHPPRVDLPVSVGSIAAAAIARACGRWRPTRRCPRSGISA